MVEAPEAGAAERISLNKFKSSSPSNHSSRGSRGPPTPSAVVSHFRQAPVSMAASPTTAASGSGSDQSSCRDSALSNETVYSDDGEDDGEWAARCERLRRWGQSSFALRLLGGIFCPLCAGNERVKEMSVYEEQAKLAKFDQSSGLSGVIPKYMALVVQVGYVVLFAPAFPLAALLCFFVNLWRLRADAYLLLFNTQRPRYRCGQDIGSLQGALHFLSALAVATHVGLLVFTSSQLHHILPLRLPILGTVTEHDKFTLLVILEHLLLAFQFLINQLLEVFLPTVPKTTSIWKAVEEGVGQMQKQQARESKRKASDAKWDESTASRAGTARAARGYTQI